MFCVLVTQQREDSDLCNIGKNCKRKPKMQHVEIHNTNQSGKHAL